MSTELAPARPTLADLLAGYEDFPAEVAETFVSCFVDYRAREAPEQPGDAGALVAAGLAVLTGDFTFSRVDTFEDAAGGRRFTARA